MTDNPQKLKFIFTRTIHDCECCGSYEDVTLGIYKNEKLLADFWKGGHFGDGVDVENIETILPMIFEELGMLAEVEIITEDLEND